MKFGNLCIAGHNYKNDTFFSNISKLNYGDIIEIHDNSGRMIKYSVFDIHKTDQADLSCTSQNTNGSRIVTLITCDSINDNYRIVVKAKEE